MEDQMSVFMLRPEDEVAIKAAMERARERPLTLDVVEKHKVPDKFKITLADRQRVGMPRQESEMVYLPMGWRLGISYEQQPGGLCIHLSMSSPTAAYTVPRPEAVQMVFQTCGLKWPPDKVWIEDFIAGGEVGKAINVIKLIEEKQ
jgi:hypothetical protein